MTPKTETALIEEILQLKASQSAFLDASTARNPARVYQDPQRFTAEQDQLFRTHPQALAHISELSEPGAFVTRLWCGRSVLLTRDEQGEIYCFLNVCRHRGMQLESAGAGCKKRFTCPYHAWTYASDGRLLAAPHFDTGFPGEDKAALGLTRLCCAQRYGFIWVWQDDHAQGSAKGSANLADYFGALDSELDALDLANSDIAGETHQRRAANWKILIEGGLEAYHFKVAHRRTIGPYFEDNLSTYQSFGPHIRSVLPRASLASLAGAPRPAGALRAHANLLYTLFPGSQLLVQQDHVVWIALMPISADETALRLCTLAPRHQGHIAEPDTDHWQHNHEITLATLEEDFVIGEAIQSGLKAGSQQDMLFGRFEGALNHFNSVIQDHLKTATG